MKKETFSININQDVTLNGLFWIPNNNPKAVVVICHGMAEHIKRYDEFANYLSENNYIVCGYDQRGHGESIKNMNEMGYMSDDDNFKTLVNDLYEVIQYSKNKYQDLPIYLLGHSMGSFVSQRYIELYGNTINGVILSGSSLNKGFIINMGHFIAKIITKAKGRRYRSKLMDKMSFGAYNKPFKPNRTNFDWLSSNEENVDKYINDKYCGQLFTVSYFMDLLQGFKDITKNYELVPHILPIYIFSGANDPVGNMGKGVNKLYKTYLKNNINDIQIKLYPDKRHEMLNETNRNEVYNDVLTWLNIHN